MTGVHFQEASGPAGLRIFAVGDIHGRLDLLEAMADRIAVDMADSPPDDWRIVFLGDYGDRGPDTRGVIELLATRCAVEPRLIALRGNHDQGLVDFISGGENARLFVNHGGAETAASYDVAAAFDTQAGQAATRDALAAAVPPRHLSFLSGLPYSAHFGDFYFCHAGIRPGIALEDQQPDDLIWIREPFLSNPALHPKVIVHGHTPVAEPEIMPNRVGVDTGAYRSGVLSALVIEGRQKGILSVSDRPG
ncbi:MAG: serine/threonine protein phosphatase [Rhizobiaceae bacterium]|nr:serine/threonine protein phosphatase [Rhizobiaceae bacterium]